jgi:uncharacterized membrane protein
VIGTETAMVELALAVAFLLATHFGLASKQVRPALVGRIGEGPYRGLYSLIAVAAFVLLAMAYNRAPYVELWHLAWGRHVTAVVMILASILAVAGLTERNPTSVGQEKALAHPEPARGIQRVTRHPVMWAVGLWAIGHILANGDLASLLLFGGVGALALVGTVLIDAKLARRFGDEWQAFAVRTSSVPFLAITRGHQRLALGETGWARIAGGLVLYLALVLVHPWLFGVPAH